MESAQLKPPCGLPLTGNLAENWRKFKQRFDLYSVASGLKEKPEEVQASALLHMVGEDALEVYNTFEFAIAADKMKVKPICDKFQGYCNPRKNVTFERYKFFTHVQGSKGIELYITELKTLSQSCELGTLCDSLIRDRIVCGISSNQLRERLLRETDLSLTKAIDICRATEASKSQAQHFKLGEASGSDEKVDIVRKKSGKSCSKCGTFHPVRQCPAYGKICHSCNKPNHFKTVCKSKNNVEQKPRQHIRKGQHKMKRVHCVNDDASSSYDEEELFIGMVKADKYMNADEWSAQLKINGKNLKFKLDTGADCNVISEALFAQIR